jgi:hypothetical protein
MLREMPFEFTWDQINKFAISNVRGLALAGITFCQDNALSTEDYWCHIGCQFTAGWEAKSTEDLVFGILGNLKSMGFEVLSVEGDAYEYTVKLTGWPSDEELEYFDITRADTDDMWSVFLPITDRLAHDFSWRRDDAIVTITITRR